MKTPFSVVIDSFNTGDFIGAAIESVIAQTRPADQIIISDASTDNSREIIERYATSERRIKTIFRENRGQLATIMAGLEAATGDLVFLLDGDDRWEPDHLAAMEGWWKKFPHADLIYCGHRLIGDEALVRVVDQRENHKQAGWLGPIDLEKPYDWGRSSALAWCLPDFHIGGITSSLSFRLEHLKRLPLGNLLSRDGEDLRTNADFMLLFASDLQGGRKVYVPEKGVRHRVHTQSTTGKSSAGDTAVEHAQKTAVAAARHILRSTATLGPSQFDLLASEMRAVPRLAAGHAKLYERAAAANPDQEKIRLSAEVATLRSENFALRGRIKALESSTSWRVTAPLRWAGDKCSFVRRRMRVKPGPRLRYEHGIVAIDISNIWYSDSGTGIQRVVRNLATELARKARDGKKVALVDYASGKPVDVTSGFLDGERAGPTEVLGGMEALIMLDSSYDLAPALANRLRQAKESGIRVVSVCHDLLPLKSPQWFTAMNHRTFRRWLHLAAEYSSHFLCVSQATQRDLVAYFESRSDLSGKPSVSSWSLGRDFNPGICPTASKDGALGKRYAVMVGTVEPRKNHCFVLDAFERMRRAGRMDTTLVVVGREGWKCRRTAAKLRQAEQEGWVTWLREGISDSRLASVYRHAVCAIQPSLAEGFGLPVAEAAHFGRPVVLSDIPVFREIVRTNGYFFALGDHDSFADAMARAMRPGAPATETISVTWRESAETFWRECVDPSRGSGKGTTPETK